MLVVIHHAIQFLPQTASSWILYRLLLGCGPVLIFFVLSGLVSAMTYVNRNGDRYLPFIAKRFFRIWMPFAFVICASAGLNILIGHHAVAGLTPAFEATWATPVTVSTLVSHLLLLGTAIDLDGPMWSLIHQLRIFIVLPFLVGAIIANWRMSLVFLTIASLLASAIDVEPGISNSFLATVRFLVLPGFGIVMALHLHHMRHFLGSASHRLRLFLWLAFLAGAAASPDYSGLGSGIVSGVRLLIHGLAAAGIILMCMSGTRSSRWLGHCVPVYFGRISYSLYLAHVVVMTAVVQLLRDTISPVASIVLGVVLAILVADALERFVERPMARIGRNVAKTIDLRLHNGKLRDAEAL